MKRYSQARSDVRRVSPCATLVGAALARLADVIERTENMVEAMVPLVTNNFVCR